MLLSAPAAILGGRVLNTATAGTSETPPHFSVVIRPHRSMSPRALAVVIILFTVLSLTIALSFLSLGLWLVLPFAGLEVLVVGVVIGLSIRSGEDYEAIAIDDDQVIITLSRNRRTKEHRFQRYWTQVRLTPGGSRLQPSRLWIGSHGQYIELGRDMTEDGREQLTVRLKRALLHGRERVS